MWQALKAFIVQLLGALSRSATILDNIAKAGENASIALEMESRTLIPSQEQHKANLDNATTARDKSIEDFKNSLRK